LEGEEPQQPDEHAEVERAGTRGRTHDGLPPLPRPPTGDPAGPAAAYLRPAPRAAGALPQADAGVDPRRGGVPPPRLAPGGNLRTAGALRRRLLRDERRAPALHPTGDGAVRLCPPARARPGPPL